MKPKKLKALIKKTQAALRWPVVVVTRGDTLEIHSDHLQRKHTITLPADYGNAGDIRDIEYLHELAHATLCETIHPLFSTSCFQGCSQQTLDTIAPAFRACSDWFADAWLMKVAPELETAEIEEHCNLVLKTLEKGSKGTPEFLFGAALMIAQGIYYCGYKLNLGGSLKQAVDAFLSVPPEKPTLQKYEKLVNLLLAIIGLRATLTTDKTAWEIPATTT